MITAFGRPVPQSVIDELVADGIPLEEITTEFIETSFEYERRDNEE